MRTEINFILGKNGGRRHSSLGCRLIVVVRQADELLAVYKIFKIRQLQSWSTFRLFEWIYGANSFVTIDERPVFEGNVIVRLVFHTQEAIYSMSIPILLSTIILNDMYILCWRHTSKAPEGVYLRMYTYARVDVYHIHLGYIMIAHLRNILVQIAIGLLVEIVIEKQSFRLRWLSYYSLVIHPSINYSS